MVNCPALMGKIKLSEWIWRFLAAAMLFTVGWTLWILYQINPPSLITDAAFEAAATARLNGKPGDRQSVHGIITPPGPEAPKGPPVNPEKLKSSEPIAIPAPDAKK